MTTKRGTAWWDQWYLGLARYYSTASKDPSTRVGAVLVSEDNAVVGTGFNGFPRGIADDGRLLDRETKYSIVLHAEANCLMRAGSLAKGSTAYLWPLPPCSRCASALIQAGVKRVVSPPPPDRWRENCRLALELFREAGVVCEEVEAA